MTTRFVGARFVVISNENVVRFTGPGFLVEIEVLSAAVGSSAGVATALAVGFDASGETQSSKRIASPEDSANSGTLASSKLGGTVGPSIRTGVIT